MLLKRISIRNFRRLQQPVDITGLGPGLNVIAGDNEEGKSTILRALRAALFDKHTLGGNAALAFQPYGSQVRPEVELEFQLEENAYRLSKGFCQRPSAELIGPDGSYAGPAAEDKLKELLGFEHPDRGPADARHHGIWGLLWIEQGTAFAPLLHNERSQRTLQTTLEAEVGEILGGQQGHAILDAVRKAHAAYFTKTGRPRGDYSDSQKTLTALNDELTKLESELQTYESDVDRLQRMREELQHWERERIIEQQQQNLLNAEHAISALESLQAELANADAELRLANSEHDAAQNRWQQRREHIQHLQVLSERLQQNAEQLTAIEVDKARLEPKQAALTTAATAAAEGLVAAQTKLAQAEAASTRLTLQRALKSNHQRLQAAKASAEIISQTQRAADKIRARPESVSALRELNNQLLLAEAQLAAGSPEIRFDLELAVTQEGVPVPTGATVPIVRRTTFDLGHHGHITVTPGETDQTQTMLQVEQFRQQHHELLAQLEAPTLADAEKALVLRQEQLQLLATHQELLSTYAPAGLDALARELERQQTELDRLTAEPLAEVESSKLDELIEHARTALTTAQTAAAQADADLAGMSQQAEQIKTRHIELTTQRRSLEDERQRYQELLADTRSRESDAALHQVLESTASAQQRARARNEQAQQRLAAAEPERLTLELEQARDTLKLSKQRYAKQQQDARGLQIQLQTQGQTGLGERYQELLAQRDQAQLQADRLEREAQSLRLLHTVLEDCARRAGETFLAPVLERVQPYLRLLTPNAELLLDSDLQLSGIRRDGIDELFNDLSIGTREQLAIIIRLAFADLLHEKGQPVVVVLDDALAYSDRDRLKRMQLILRRAAQRYQILILTCRERDHLELGAPIIRLADCRETIVEPA